VLVKVTDGKDRLNGADMSDDKEMVHAAFRDTRDAVVWCDATIKEWRKEKNPLSDLNVRGLMLLAQVWWMSRSDDEKDTQMKALIEENKRLRKMLNERRR